MKMVDVILLENLMQFYDGLSESDARPLQANIGVKRGNVFRTVQQLSGGGKMELAMLIVSHQPESSLLLLDEPDNHLDFPSKQMLAQALLQYNGSFILISHDDAFIESCGITETIELGTNGWST